MVANKHEPVTIQFWGSSKGLGTESTHPKTEEGGGGNWVVVVVVVVVVGSGEGCKLRRGICYFVPPIKVDTESTTLRWIGMGEWEGTRRGVGGGGWG